MSNTDTLHNYDKTDIGHDGSSRYTDPQTGAWVELIHDPESSHHPMDGQDGITIAFREGDHYTGLADDIPRDLEVECGECRGLGYTDEDDEVECIKCQGEGTITVPDIETFVAIDRGARAAYVFDAGSHGEATAVVYVTDDDWTEPEKAVKAWAEEYQSWAEGDIWGIRSGDSITESDDDVWGFIGREHAEAEALSYLKDRIEEVKIRRERNIIKGEG